MELMPVMLPGTNGNYRRCRRAARVPQLPPRRHTRPHVLPRGWGRFFGHYVLSYNSVRLAPRSVGGCDCQPPTGCGTAHRSAAPPQTVSVQPMPTSRMAGPPRWIPRAISWVYHAAAVEFEGLSATAYATGVPTAPAHASQTLKVRCDRALGSPFVGGDASLRFHDLSLQGGYARLAA